MIEFDWKRYFEDFCAEHGDPIEIDGRLWFPDGWSYASRDHRGPEYRPPTDGALLLKYQKLYWQTKLNKMKERHDRLQTAIILAEEATRIRSAPIYEKVRIQGDDGQVVTDSRPLDTEAWKMRQSDVAQEIEHCSEQLRLLGAKERTPNDAEQQVA